MDNPETSATLGTQDTGRRETKKKQKTKMISNTGSHQKTGVKPGVDDICCLSSF